MTWKKKVLPEIFDGQIQPTIHLSHEKPQKGHCSAVSFKKVCIPWAYQSEFTEKNLKCVSLSCRFKIDLYVFAT